MNRPRPIDKKISVGIRLSTETYKSLKDRALLEHRTVSALTAIIIEEVVTPRKEKT